MTINPKLVLHGVSNGVNINADISRVDHSAPVKVHLTYAYAIGARDPGIPYRPQFTGAAAANLDYPRTIPINTTLLLHKHEADALVAAGCATYV